MQRKLLIVACAGSSFGSRPRDNCLGALWQISISSRKDAFDPLHPPLATQAIPTSAPEGSPESTYSLASLPGRNPRILGAQPRGRIRSAYSLRLLHFPPPGSGPAACPRHPLRLTLNQAAFVFYQKPASGPHISARQFLRDTDLGLMSLSASVAKRETRRDSSRAKGAAQSYLGLDLRFGDTIALFTDSVFGYAPM